MLAVDVETVNFAQHFPRHVDSVSRIFPDADVATELQEAVLARRLLQESAPARLDTFCGKAFRTYWFISLR